MTKADIAILLSFVSTLDGRVAFDEPAVEAWALVLDRDMPREWANEFVRNWYGRNDVAVVPAALNREWREACRMRSYSKAQSDAHCRRHDCTCTHERCFRGWMDREDGSATVPCPVCRRSLADALLHVQPLGERSQQDYSYLQNRYRGESA